MKHCACATTRSLAILTATLCAFGCAACKTGNQSGIPEMQESTAFPTSDAFADRFAISPDGTAVVYAPDHVSVWDGDRAKPFEVRDARTSSKIADIHLPVSPAFNDQIGGVQFCDHGKYLLLDAGVYFDPDHPPTSVKTLGPNAEADYFKVLETQSYKLRTDISLGDAEYDIPQEVTAQPHAAYEGRGSLSQVACAANAPIVAVVVGHALHLIAIKLFNLETGAEVGAANDLVLHFDVLGAAISPDGTNLALFRSRGNDETEDPAAVDFQITVIDLRAKKAAKGIWVRTPYNFNAIKYAGDSTVAVEFFDQKQYESPTENWTGPQYIFRTRAAIHFFDASSGAALRTISGPDNREFRLLDISADGRTMLVRTDSDHFCFSCNGGGGEEVISDARFTLWNSQAGNPIAESPSLKVVHHWCLLPRWASSGGGFFGGNCIASDEEPELELSQGGRAVAALWRGGGEPLQVYSLPSR
jgi:hypothetical protein